jgi:hypothetical protein
MKNQSTQEITCPTGYTLIDGQCIKNVDAPIASAVTSTKKAKKK